MATSKKTRSAYFIVNPAGAVHEVSREHAAQRLRQPGFRKATADEVKAFQGQRVQRHDRPIATPWNPEPEAIEVDLD